MIERFTPEYADRNVTTEERAERLVEVAKEISYWDSFVPPVLFHLRLNEESTLTLEERRMRLGVNNAIGFDWEGLDGEGRRGRLERFIVEGINDNDELVEVTVDTVAEGSVEVDSSANPSSRRLAAATTNSDNIDNALPKNNIKKKQAHRRMQDNPPAIDWHKSGYTTLVKNQGYCGCCWAVSVTAAIESALMITNKTSKFDALTKNSLSFQQMISCDEKNLACDGGNILYAAKYAWDHNDFSNDHYGGLVSYEDYPYEDLFGLKDSRTCKTAGKTPVAFLNYPKIVTSVNDRSGFEERRDLMITAVAQQPVPMTLMS